MRSYAMAALLAGAAIASPLPQGLDFAAIDALDPVPTPSIPIVNAAAAQTTITFAATLAASSVSAAIQANPTDTTPKMVKRVDDSSCAVQPAADDTADNFSSNTAFSDAANGAVTPAGWTLAYANQAGSSQSVYGYMGYSVLSSYDTAACTAECDAIEGCSSVNIYYERDPSVDPTSTCTNPPSSTAIKCVYYGGPVTASSATNDGQWRYDFHVVIAGSNGYVNNSIATPSGYSGPIPLGNAAINAPLDCAGHDTYMGVKIFTSGPFDAGLCAAACSSQSEYNLAHPPSDWEAQTCQFFNTYVLYDGSESVGQYCTLYNETWRASYATNDGQWRGEDHYTIGYSYAFSNSTGGADEPATCANAANP
ncbi:hypothetical protein LTR02_009572 [Friedmanniomyces endolithicus]|nr:hypothetical protein LTR59_010586 [Friedmanniomyces endolithicus]KAK0791385.1 hypothetical protein LTR75_011763 [Friedmanniomyces endolithicus]KAK0899660.1 hypothetical protein LTR02_009572 [Friedmanniomyces endolithicus]